MGEDFELPSNSEQSKSVVDEQIKILKSLNIKEPLTELKLTPETNKSGSSKDSNYTYKKREKTTNFIPNTKPIDVSASNMKEKLEYSEPYNIFFTKVPDAPMTVTASNSISFPGFISFIWIMTIIS